MAQAPRSSSRSKKQRPKASQPANPTAHDVCFVIMPFGGWLDNYYEAIYCPAIKAAGLEPHRADDLYRPSTITNDIWEYTRRAKLLPADLSGRNPNVFYELGLAHALAKPAILIAESIEEIPFDLRALRILVYDKNDPKWGEQLRLRIEASIKEVIEAPKEAVLPAFLEVRDRTPNLSVTSHEKELIEIKQELELLRREVRNRAPQYEPRSSSPMRSSDVARLLRSLVDDGLSDEEILHRTEGLAHSSWIRFILERIRIEREQPSLFAG